MFGSATAMTAASTSCRFGKYAHAGQRILPLRRSPSRAWRARRRHYLGLVRFRARRRYRLPPRSRETAPMPSGKAGRSNLRPRRSRRPDRRRWRDATSSMRMSWVLRAMRRAKRSGRPRAAVNGKTVIASAPPSAAANTAMVARKMFTCGSRCAIMRQAVSAETNAGCGASPHEASTRAHSFRSARNLAMVRN